MSASGGGMGYGGGHAGGYAGGYRDQGDVHTQAFANPTAIDALESAVALPGVFTHAELHRALRRNRFDVMKTALLLREKHALRKQQHYDALNIGMNTLQIELKKGYVHLLENASDLENCPVVLLQLKFFKPSFSSDKMQLKGTGAMDGSSSLEDTRRLCVYVMDLAVEVMEENRAAGVVFLVDLDSCAVSNLETKLVTDILQLLKSWYPECVRHVLVINGTAFTRGITHVLTRLASERTQQRIRILQHVSELRNFLSPQSIPHMYGGTYRLMPPSEWMALQAEIEDVDLASQAPAPTEQQYMTKDARQLNGMQYAACSVDQVVEMKTSVLRGPLFRNKSGVAWVKMYAILRPEALLLYESVTATMPQIIVPVNHEVAVAAATFADAPKGSFGFRVEVPGVAGGHLLAAASDHERGNWLQEIQMAITAHEEEVAREQYEEEKRLREEREFAALNMISFDDPAPTLSPSVAHQQQPSASQSLYPQAPGQSPLAAMPAPGASAGYVVAPSLLQQQQYNMVNPMAMMGVAPGSLQQQQQLVRPPQPVSLPTGQQQPQQQPVGMGMGMHMMPMQQPPPPYASGMAMGGGAPSVFPMQHMAQFQQQPQQFPMHQMHPQQQQQFYNGSNMPGYRG